MWLAPALAMVLGIVSGWTRPRPWTHRSSKPASMAACPPTAEPQTIAAFFAQLGRELEFRIANASRAATTENCAKRSSCASFPPCEMLQGIEAADLGAVLHFQADAGDIGNVDGADAGAAFAERFPVFSEIEAQG